MTGTAIETVLGTETVGMGKNEDEALNTESEEPARVQVGKVRGTVVETRYQDTTARGGPR